MKVKQLITALFGLVIISSCSIQKGYLLFTGKQNEIIATPLIKDYLFLNPKPSIVVKVPSTETRVTQADPNSYIYNAIEKELLIAGFNVKDRGLFNEVLNKSIEINYADIRKLTGTDLILELVQVVTDIKYSTNIFYHEDGKENVIYDAPFIKYGALIEFKLTLVEQNQYAGSYLFNYVPCVERYNDCECEVAYKKFPSQIYPQFSFCNDVNNVPIEAYEHISPDRMTEFVRSGVKLMINEIKK